MQHRKYFGTDGIRGRVGHSLINVEFMLKLGWAFGKVLAEDNKVHVLIGRDTRISGPMLESALEAGLSAAGVDVYLLDVIPTPGVAYLTHSLRACAGIVISASHNPYQDNGIKFFDSEGMKLPDELELEIEKQIDKPMKTEASDRLGKVKHIMDAAGRYIEFCKSIFPAQLSLKGLKLVVDCANGATHYVALNIFHELGANVIAIHYQPDGFNINDKCGAMDVRQLQKTVTKNSADVGIAFDGDGDRLIMVDHRGEIVDGDEILCILAKDIDVCSRVGIVGTVMSNLGLENALKESGIEFVRTPVGDRYVLEELLKRDWILGGESSGHIVDLNLTTTGDGIITALQILRIMQMSAFGLHDLKKKMQKCPQVLINVPVYGDKDLSKYPKIDKAIARVEKQLNGRGRILLRPSGTEPCIRVMVEGEDEKQVRKIAESLAEVVEREVR